MSKLLEKTYGVEIHMFKKSFNDITEEFIKGFSNFCSAMLQEDILKLKDWQDNEILLKGLLHAYMKLNIETSTRDDIISIGDEFFKKSIEL